MDVRLNSMKNCELVEVSGRIDSYTAAQLSDVLNQLANRNCFKIIMDLQDVSYVSSAGLRVLIDIQKKCKVNHQGEVLLVNIPQRVYETLELAGFVPLFKFFNNVASAVAVFQ
jgi:anti-sigma B factor antagonist